MHFSDTGKRRIGRKTVIITAVAVALAALTVFTIYDINGHSLDLRDREVRLIVTDSMDGEPMSYDVPTIHKNSLVMVKFLSEDEKKNLKVGDVIQFWDHGILNHHRVKETYDNYVITHGDNLDPSIEEKVYFSNIRGEVVGENHAVGEVFTFVKTYALVIIAFIVVLFIGSLLLEELRRGNEKED